MSDFEITTQTVQEMTVVNVLGFLDAHTFEYMQEALDRLFSANRIKIAINLDKVEYISSAGAGVFIGAMGKAQDMGGDIVLINPQPNVLEVFELLGLTSILPFAKSVKEALAYFKKPKS